MAKTYSRSELTGGGSNALDGIDGDILVEGDRAIVINDSYAYFYYLNETSGESESSPQVIEPDDNADDKRWILQSTFTEKIRDRNIFIQSSEPSDDESSEGDIWIDIS